MQAIPTSRKTNKVILLVVLSTLLLLIKTQHRKYDAALLASSWSRRALRSSSSSNIPHAVTHRSGDFPPQPPSPFEQRRPKQQLPEWAIKPFFFRRAVPTRVCFVHVGKAAGSSLGCSLGFQLHCQKEMKYPLGLLPSYTTNLIHTNVNDCSMDMDYYMFSIRDPLERIRSWYVYDKKWLNGLREDCGFKTLNDLAELGLKKNSSVLCINRAKRAIRGEEKFGKHAYHNYGHFFSQVPSNASITVIRTEHMVEDWNSMEQLLGGHHVVKMLPERNANTKKSTDEKYLSEDSKHLICEQLCDEIQVYKELLSRAINLNSTQAEQSMQELRRTCPREADMPACPK